MREVGRLPALSRIGLALMAVALVGDVVLRLMPVAGEHAAHGSDEHLAHLLALGAMGLVMAGVVIDAVRHRTRRRASHAHR
jgi:hypothetical protein